MKFPLLLAILTAAVMTPIALPATETQADIQVSPDISRKLVRRSPLSVAEIAALSRSGFSEAQLRSHLQASRADYQLTTDSVAELQAAGVSNVLIDEMLARAYAQQPVHRYVYTGYRYPRAFLHHGGRSFGFHGGRGGFHGGGHGHH